MTERTGEAASPFHSLVDGLRPHGLPLFLLLLCAAVLVRTAWLAEDAFITFRTIDNFINGYGLRWNVDERVQTYTHPLWLLLISLLSFFTREVPYTALSLSLLCSLVAVYMLSFRLAHSVAVGALALGLCLSSKAFIDFSTSGLENPLTHVLVAAFVLLYRRPPSEGRNLLYLSLVTALAVVNRMDIGVLLGPGLAAACWRVRSVRALWDVALGFLPFVAWELFSLVYYGFLVPNTAYAKLNTGIPLGELVERGLWYIENSLRWDPPTLTAMGLVCAWSFLRGARGDWPLVFGALLYVLYVVRIGGDFMSGRFFSAPFFLLLCVLVGGARSSLRVVGALLFGLLLVQFGLPRSSLLSDSTYGRSEALEYNENRISDERGWFYPNTGLLPKLLGVAEDPFWTLRGKTVREHGINYTAHMPTVRAEEYVIASSEGYFIAESTTGRIVTTWENIGFSSFYAGPNVYVIDAFALSDPLLARLPTFQDSLWGAGHFKRIVLAGYVETHISGENKLEDRDLARYYNVLKVIISGDLFSVPRWRAIWRFHTGHYRELVDLSFYRFPSELEKTHSNTRIRPRNPVYQLKLAEALFNEGDSGRARDALTRALELDMGSGNNHLFASRLLLESGYFREAYETLRDHMALIDMLPDLERSSAFSIMGSCLFQLGLLREAERSFVQSVSIYESWEDRLNIVSVRMNQNDVQGAISALRESIRFGAQFERVLPMVRYIESVDIDAARGLYRQVLVEMRLSDQERGEIQQRLRALE